jgi:NAD(P)H-flavin reductase
LPAAEDDILVRSELETLAMTYPDRFQLQYTVDRAPPNWKYSTGFITKDMIAQYLFTPNGTLTQIFMCGPPPMTKVRVSVRLVVSYRIDRFHICPYSHNPIIALLLVAPHSLPVSQI